MVSAYPALPLIIAHVRMFIHFVWSYVHATRALLNLYPFTCSLVYRLRMSILFCKHIYVGITLLPWSPSNHSSSHGDGGVGEVRHFNHFV